jgi:hypothetical protein
MGERVKVGDRVKVLAEDCCITFEGVGVVESIEYEDGDFLDGSPRMDTATISLGSR